MKKLLVLLISAMLFISCSIAASAAEGEEYADVVENSDNVYENAEQTTEDSNPFSLMYEYVAAHADNIFSALAFVGSLVLAFFYKKGLMPALSSALGNLRSSVKSISETAEKTLVGSENAFADFKTSVDLVAGSLDTLTSSVAELDKRLCAGEEQISEMKAMKTIMSAQVDMLYSIFMSSALPQYSKDEVGARISEMRAALADPVTSDE